MANTVDLSGKPFHFIGIGGIGMSALAYILAKRRLPVSGSDIRSTHITQRLEEVGAHIFSSQEAENLDYFSNKELNLSSVVAVNGKSSQTSTPKTTQLPSQILPQVICSTAISQTNSEYEAALNKECPIFHRSDLLAALIADYQSVAVAGTHGKTTTSSLISYLLLQADLDPTIIVGGEVKAWEGNARVGSGKYLVAEADESDGSLVKLSANIGVITNIELDHPDHYQTLDEVVSIFETFAHQCETVIGCIDCDTVQERISPQISYGILPNREADYTVSEVHYADWGTKAQVWERGELLGELQVQLLGEHNLKNALAAVAVGRKLGLEFSVIAKGLAGFEGAKRRFEHCGEAGGIVFFDDYAHHPSEIRVTLAAAHLRVKASYKRLIAIFQPHRYSRTQTFLKEFAQSFDNADVVIVTDIYSAGESNAGQLTGQDVADAIAAYHSQVLYSPSLESMTSFLSEVLQPGDFAIFLGAGNLNQIIPELLSQYEDNTSSH